VTKFPIIVNLRRGKTAEILSIEASIPNKGIVYVRFMPELTSKDTDTHKDDPLSYYQNVDVYRLFETASKLVHKHEWPREYRLYVIAIPYALVLFILGWLFSWTCFVAAIVMLIIPLKRKRRIRIAKAAVLRMHTSILEAAAHRVIQETSVLDRLTELQPGVWFAYSTITFWQPKFWD
jgi:hypothetical protein